MTISQDLLQIPVNRENCSNVMKTTETVMIPPLSNGDTLLGSDKPFHLLIQFSRTSFCKCKLEDLVFGTNSQQAPTVTIAIRNLYKL
jgi:hypothetical protein